MRYLLIILTAIIFFSCDNKSKEKQTKDFNSQKRRDTTLIAVKNKIDKSYENGLYRNSFLYAWVSDQDTLDFKILVTEWIKDSSVHINFIHKNPILFSNSLSNLEEALPIIKKEFDIDNLNSIYLQAPIFYKDLTVELTNSFNEKFPNRNIKYSEVSNFLINSPLQYKLSEILRPLNHSIKRYNIEKFQILERENYDYYIEKEDFQDYPSFSIHGVGIFVELKKE